MIHFYLFWGAQEEKDMLIIGFGHRVTKVAFKK